MKKTLSLLLALCLLPLALSAQQTLYVIDNVTVDNFDGSQLKGKTIKDYRISTSGSGRRAVTVHSITTAQPGISVYGYGNFPDIKIPSPEQLEKLRLQADTLRIRLRPGQDPDDIVYFIDGIRADNASILNKIPADQIKGIRVLKDAESQARYHLPGKDIIEIQTKTGLKDLLDKLPGVTIDENGRVSVQGEPVKSITTGGITVNTQ